MRKDILIPLAIALGVIWGAVALVMSATDPYIATPEKLLALISEPPWKNGRKPPAAERQAFLQQVSDLYNALDLTQKRQVRDLGRNQSENFMLDLTEQERQWFADQTIEKQVQPLLKLWGNMNKEQRNRLLRSAMGEMQRHQGTDSETIERLRQDDSKLVDKLVNEGLDGYYKASSQERKAMLAPLLEALQERVGGN